MTTHQTHQTHPIALQLIDKAIGNVAQLHQLLTQESDLFKTKKSYQKLENITAQKNEVIQKLTTFSRQVEQILMSEGVEKDGGMEEYFSIAQTAGLDTSISLSQWKKFTQLTEQCRSLNESNGACLYILNKHCTRILDVLKGKNSSLSTYTKNGHTNSNTFSTPIISV